VAALVLVLVAVSVHYAVVDVPWASPLGVRPVALAVVGSEHLLVAGSSVSDPGRGAIATSDDGGTTWSSRQLDTPPVNGIAASLDNVLLTADCAHSSGPDCVWLSVDGGSSFMDSPGVPRLVHPGFDYKEGYAMTPDGATLWVTDDAGATWAQTGTACGSGGTVTIDWPSRMTSWTACAGDMSGGQQGRTIRSTQEIMSSIGLGRDTGLLPSEGELLGISMTADGHGWLWTNDRLYATLDGGRTWLPVGAAHPGSRSVVAARLVSPQTGFAILSDGLVRWLARTEDGGVSWTALTGFPNR
jgi:photosystem II stability/assembly factor-like uncharacterized protein